MQHHFGYKCLEPKAVFTHQQCQQATRRLLNGDREVTRVRALLSLTGRHDNPFTRTHQ